MKPQDAESLYYGAEREKVLQADCLEYLRSIGCLVLRINSGAMKTANRWVTLAPKGTSDIIGCTPDGRFLAVEVKRPGNNPTEAQQSFLDSVKGRGGIAIVANTVTGLAKELDRQAKTTP